MVLASIFKLFFLLMNLSINFLSYLAKLELRPHDLVLLLFQSCFCFFQSCLQFLLLNFKSATLFVKLMNGSSAITKLVQKILDFIGQVLVFSFDNIKLLHGSVPC